MYRVLVIGCGGSGAKTLAYMMDQLRADLKVYGIKEIPGCWQFLNVDTPLQEELPTSVAPVSRQGGHYVSCGVSSGRALVEAVVAWWRTLPQDHRPRLLLYGESLGVVAGEAAFGGLADLVGSVDGVLWVGPPRSSRIWDQLVARRDPGTCGSP